LFNIFKFITTVEHRLPLTEQRYDDKFDEFP